MPVPKKSRKSNKIKLLVLLTLLLGALYLLSYGPFLYAQQHWKASALKPFYSPCARLAANFSPYKQYTLLFTSEAKPKNSEVKPKTSEPNARPPEAKTKTPEPRKAPEVTPNQPDPKTGIREEERPSLPVIIE